MPHVARPQDSALTEALLRVFGLLVCAVAVRNLARVWWADPERWTVLLLLVIETVTWCMVLFARRADRRDLSLAAMAQTAFAALYFVLLDARDTRHLVPEAVGVALQVAGAGFQFSAKLVLGRAFGLLPARRGLVTRGPYRLVRHPIYLGYLVSHVGFLLANASWRNAAVFAALYLSQGLRILREEAVLSGDEAYRAYRARVRWRLLPPIF